MLDFVPGWVWGKDVEIFPVAAVLTEDVVPVVLDGIGKGSPRSEYTIPSKEHAASPAIGDD